MRINIHTVRDRLHHFTRLLTSWRYHRLSRPMISAAVIVLSLFLIVRIPATTALADNEDIVYGRPALGQISDDTYQVGYDFRPNAKDRVNIIVDRTSDSFVPTLEVHDESGQVIAKADHDATYARAAIMNLTMPSPGHYTIVVGRYDGQSGKTFGNYKLIVTLLGLGADGFNPTFVEAELKIGQQRDGSLSEEKWRDAWAFQTTDNQPITILASRIRGTLIPVIELFDSNWKSVAKGQLDDSFTMTSIVKFIPTPASQYYVVITRLDGTDGATVGDYRLIVAPGQPQ